MFVYKFEKGTIKTGVDYIPKEDYKLFENYFGTFKRLYNDNKHTDEELEFQHVFATILNNDDDEYRLVFTKDEDEIFNMEIAEDKYRRAWVMDIDYSDDNKPINIIVEEGYHTWVEEEYIDNIGHKQKWRGYIEVI